MVASVWLIFQGKNIIFFYQVDYGALELYHVLDVARVYLWSLIDDLSSLCV